MFFYLSKIFWFFCKPLNLIGLTFIFGLAFYRHTAGKRLLLCGAVSFVMLGFVPVGPFAVLWLEHRVPPVALPGHVDGIIVLGGALDGEGSLYHRQPQINEWAERITEMIRLSHIYPQAKIVYSGGSGSLSGREYKESDIVQKMLVDMGLPAKNFVAENASRTTYENVANSKALVFPQAGENWVLVTSAFHMPRSLMVFKKQGWVVIPYPAGYIENDGVHGWHWFDVSGNYWKLNIAVKEIIGIIAYQISGRI